MVINFMIAVPSGWSPFDRASYTRLHCIDGRLIRNSTNNSRNLFGRRQSCPHTARPTGQACRKVREKPGSVTSIDPSGSFKKRSIAVP